jgi:exodeoxyribonuclease V alpha subunit
MPVSVEKEPPRGPTEEGPPLRRDFFILDREDPLEIQATLLDVLTRRLPTHGFDPRADVQVLVPVHRGEVGTIVLNQRLQALNPGPRASGEARLDPLRFRAGDRVIQTRNNYEAEVFNGEVGRVVEAAPEFLRVDFDGRELTLAGDALDDLEPAWAITVHKSQGSEYPAVVIPILTQHYILLQRNLLYTGVTRGKKLVVIVGTKKALAIAIRNNKTERRFTLLAERLRA